MCALGGVGLFGHLAAHIGTCYRYNGQFAFPGNNFGVELLERHFLLEHFIIKWKFYAFIGQYFDRFAAFYGDRKFIGQYFHFIGTFSEFIGRFFDYIGTFSKYIGTFHFFHNKTPPEWDESSPIQAAFPKLSPYLIISSCEIRMLQTPHV